MPACAPAAPEVDTPSADAGSPGTAPHASPPGSGVRALGSACIATLYAGNVPLYALADGTVHCGLEDARGVRVHSALLAATADAGRTALLTTGEDGRVCRTNAQGVPQELGTLPRKWITSVAQGALGDIAYASGRSVWVRGTNGALRELAHARSAAGIAFSPEGKRLAVARYGGITVHDLWDAVPPVELDWKGIYSGVTCAPDGRFVLAFMQDAEMHGWRLPDATRPARHFRMTGYSARIRDWAWSADGRWLATSGAHAAIVWPFGDEDGPMGSTALELGARRDGATVSCVAFHPSEPLLAIGYSDGALALASIDDADAERTLRAGEAGAAREAARGALSAISWHNAGLRIAYGTQAGECGVLDAPRPTRTGG